MRAVHRMTASERPHGQHPSPDFGYRIVVRTVLWVIAGAVFVGFALWWVLT